ncbi:MAG TPA: PEP/pyruvate-binding domain-containing protein [Spirochaetota bacterium]|nr:PEP/pyruvate-binding domain-containing protein [Spirochaetota bacterium]HPI88447.1 PEP/pyruvate-binding domain-containing protein [Spirochaetota bacterium]HPR48810.1 PEP/pyruvate-binding domain-containing protein [Spirochaetota bacterium]
MDSYCTLSTGSSSLDSILNCLHQGDNVVWQVDSVDDYRQYVASYVKRSLEQEKKVVYMRFAAHPPLLDEDPRITVCQLNAYSGFETFSKEIYTIATEMGEDVHYVFDCLSDLLSAWATDLMIGNFFVITCPYLYELSTIAYFALLRNRHNYTTIARIRETTQVLIDLHNIDGEYFVHPLKVKNRYSPTMFFPHYWNGKELLPISESDRAAKFITYMQKTGLESTRRNLDFFDKLFLSAENMLGPETSPQQKESMVDQLCRIIISRDEKILDLAKSLFCLEDFLTIKNRLIGTGFVGGKTAGMLIARKIIETDPGFAAKDIFEPHDSFYIGSDIFYTYIVQNGWWKLYMEQKTTEGYFTVAETLRDMLLSGTFPEEIKEKFMLMIEYYGQSPIIVRSSSLLEDAFGNAFAGKYESHFLVNQGTPQQRFQQFVDVVRKIFASTMSDDALTYRLQRGLQNHDEHMALLVQRVSGSRNGKYFFPDVAGVGLSYNTYIWNSDLDPHAGMLRLVLGLGTRAVNRIEGDYPRIVSLDDPLRQPLEGMYDVRRFSQHDVDVLDIENNIIDTISFPLLLEGEHTLPLDTVAVRDYEAEDHWRERGITGKKAYLLTFEKFLGSMTFAEEMKSIMAALQQRYSYPVDIEFTVNFNGQEKYRINLLQCRPHQTSGLKKQITMPASVDPESVFFEARGNFLGGNCAHSIRRIIYVEPEEYSALTQTDKYSVARLIGRLNRLVPDRDAMPVMLFGPGRWGSTTPSLGVPIRFAEISNARALVEIARMSDNIMPELSFGSHFFLDLVEMDIFYAALFPEKNVLRFSTDTLKKYPNIFTDLLPEESAFSRVIHVYDLTEQPMQLLSDILTQRVLCYR